MESIIKTPSKTFSLLKISLCTCIILSLLNCVAANEGKKNESKSERYPLVVFDFERVELPFVICLWVLIASLAKIGKLAFNVKLMSACSVVVINISSIVFDIC